MSLKHALAAVVPLSAGLAGCRPNELFVSWQAPHAAAAARSAAPAGGGSRPRSAGATTRPARARRRPTTPAEPTGTLTLRDALAAAVGGNPELAAFSWEIRAADARALQAGLSPNPELRLRFDDFGGSGRLSGTDESEQLFRLTQVVELGDKAAKRRAVAQLEAVLSRFDYKAKRRQVFAVTAMAFYTALAAQKRVALAQESVGLAERFAAVAKASAQAGALTHLEAAKARVSLGTCRIDLEQAKQALAEARLALAASWGSEEAKFTEVAGRLDATRPPPPLERALARARRNPDVARWETQLRLRQAAVELEQARRIPDIELLGGMRRVQDTRDYGFFVGFDMELPLFDRNQGGLHEAQVNRLKAACERRAAAVTVAAAVRRAHRQVAAAHAVADLWQKEVLPAAREAFETADAARRKGAALTEMDVLRAERTLVDARAQHLDALAAYHTAAVALEQLIGQPIKTPAKGGNAKEPQGGARRTPRGVLPLRKACAE